MPDMHMAWNSCKTSQLIRNALEREREKWMNYQLTHAGSITGVICVKYCNYKWSNYIWILRVSDGKEDDKETYRQKKGNEIIPANFVNFLGEDLKTFLLS